MEYMEPETSDDATDPSTSVDEGARDDYELAEDEEQPLARVRYGLGKELWLYPDALVVLHREEHDETRYSLSNIQRIVLTPGEVTPSKLVLMLDLDDDNTVIAAEGMSNVRDFRKLLARLPEVAPEIALDPPDMDEQLRQALDIRRRTQIGCYGAVLAACLLVWAVYLVVAFIGAQAHR